MKVLSSLRSRIFLASALLAVLCLGMAIYLVSARVTDEAERTLEREITATAAQVDLLRAERTQTFTLMARLIADLPKLKAAVETNDPPTVQDIAGGYQAQLHASLVLVTNKAGQVLYSAGGSPRAAAITANQPAIRDAIAGRDSLSVLPQPNGILQVITVPVALDRPRPEILGTLSAGFLLDDGLAAQLKKITGSDLAFGMDGQILAATLPRDAYPVLAERLRSRGISRIHIGDDEYEALPRPLAAGPEPAPGNVGAVALILRSRTEQLQSLGAIHTGLFATAIVAVLLATVLSFTVARTIARPLATITNGMREVAATGDLTRKIALGETQWEDEDARLLATTFNTLTDSIARFQREMSQKERLTSLGRMSTVIAHEIRNPLMIIKATLNTLRRQDLTLDERREAVADIAEETMRLNRIVTEVLDFAKPITFEYAESSLNDICLSSATAAWAGEFDDQVALEFDSSLPHITTDPERLRAALVNILTNARHAVHAAHLEENRASVVVRTRGNGNGHVLVSIRDRGIGIAAEDMPHIFDPYFTTRRAGTGLGLPISKNIIEGLGGTLAVDSELGVGTEILIDLPTTPPEVHQ